MSALTTTNKSSDYLYVFQSNPEKTVSVPISDAIEALDLIQLAKVHPEGLVSVYTDYYPVLSHAGTLGATKALLQNRTSKMLEDKLFLNVCIHLNATRRKQGQPNDLEFEESLIQMIQDLDNPKDIAPHISEPYTSYKQGLRNLLLNFPTGILTENEELENMISKLESDSVSIPFKDMKHKTDYTSTGDYCNSATLAYIDEKDNTLARINFEALLNLKNNSTGKVIISIWEFPISSKTSEFGDLARIIEYDSKGIVSDKTRFPKYSVEFSAPTATSDSDPIYKLFIDFLGSDYIFWRTDEEMKVSLTDFYNFHREELKSSSQINEIASFYRDNGLEEIGIKLDPMMNRLIPDDYPVFYEVCIEPGTNNSKKFYYVTYELAKKKFDELKSENNCGLYRNVASGKQFQLEYKE
ncbi:hypothetical protein JXA85_02700 [Candidatus Woesearchaeota archaeon]|nr:hypothetical protein [Candidatus Woesearchaeota archaeon]